MHTIPLQTPLDDTGLPHRPSCISVDTSRFNHPHFLGASPGDCKGVTVYSFTPFTGLEPRPNLHEDALNLGWQHWQPLSRQYDAADILWSQARLRRQAKPLLDQAAARWSAWTVARSELVAVFEKFWETADGQWRAQLLRLTDAETAAKKAADAWDTLAGKLAKLAADQVDVAGWEDELSLTQVAKELGYDASDWMIQHVDHYTEPLREHRIVRGGKEYWERDTPLHASVAQLIEAQRDRLREVAALAGAAGPGRSTAA